MKLKINQENAIMSGCEKLRTYILGTTEPYNTLYAVLHIMNRKLVQKEIKDCIKKKEEYGFN